MAISFINSNAELPVPLAQVRLAQIAKTTVQMGNSQQQQAPVVVLITVSSSLISGCNSACTKCIAGGANDCNICANNKVLNPATKTCDDACPTGQYLDPTANVCLGKLLFIQNALRIAPLVIQSLDVFVPAAMDQAPLRS